ncbi:MAG TPA: hypothetical protein PLF84_23515, partial [Bryobacteraceae bacterium]|nr:hypothetical protein [Bryobacteraceae bacterium]
MSFYQRYELIKLVFNGEPKSFLAREVATGQEVFLHLWSPGARSAQTPLLLQLRALLDSGPAATSGQLLEVKDSDEPPYAVTAVVDGFSTLDEWSRRFTGQPAAPPAPPP